MTDEPAPGTPASGTRTPGTTAPGAPVRRRLHELPTLAVIGVLALGLVGVGLDHWRKGAIVIGIAPLLAAGLRLVLPAREVAPLAVRGRGFDVVLLACLGLAVIVLAYVVPVYYHAR
ncbi:MAG: DUF3017 domain-containing protein [Frankiaceae bacterium]